MSRPLLDREEFDALQELPNPEEMVPRLVSVFLREAEGLILEAREALAADDLVRVARAAHGLRGSGSFVGAARLTEEARLLEQAADRQERSELEAGVDRLAATFGETRVLLLAALEQVTAA
ncbi:MAG: Hpt domain-containing protein [Chloroflexi bacterium]|nr:Hpt domain-containing protein [Chloroflexota bacterium]